MLRERRARETEALATARKRGSQKVASRGMTNTAEAQVDLRGELEAWQSRTVDVSSLERAQRHSGAAPKQRDFRHVLRQPDHMRKERGRGKKAEERGRGEKEGERGGRQKMTVEKWRGRRVEERGGGRKGREEERERGRKEARLEERTRQSRSAEDHHDNELDFDSETQF